MSLRALADRLWGTRRARRRLYVVATSGALGLSVPLWLPALLAPLPAFQVQEIQVTGTRFVEAAEVLRLAAIETDASVWDDESEWEARVVAHPLIELAEVRRDGFHTLEIRVVEDRPVALVATPDLEPVNADGRLLPLDPAAVALDLPLLSGPVAVEAGRLADPAQAQLVELLGILAEHDAGFVDEISEVGYAEGGGYEVIMLPTASVDAVLLPIKNPERGLSRVSLALGDMGGGGARRADARFEEQVILTLETGE